jgi:quinol monooxygenase YgiN
VIAIAVKLVAKEGQEERVRDALARNTAPTLAEPGCRMFQAHSDPSDPRVFFVYEQWDDDAAIEAHRETPHYEELAVGVIFDAVEYRDRLMLAPFGG